MCIRDSTGGMWAHLVCVNWLPEIYYIDDDKETVHLEDYDFSRHQYECSACAIKYGACIKCDAKDCLYCIHPKCGQRQGILRPWDELNDLRDTTNENYIKMYCEDHLRKYHRAIWIKLVENKSTLQEINDDFSFLNKRLGKHENSLAISLLVDFIKSTSSSLKRELEFIPQTLMKIRDNNKNKSKAPQKLKKSTLLKVNKEKDDHEEIRKKKADVISSKAVGAKVNEKKEESDTEKKEDYYYFSEPLAKIIKKFNRMSKKEMREHLRKFFVSKELYDERRSVVVLEKCPELSALLDGEIEIPGPQMLTKLKPFLIKDTSDKVDKSHNDDSSMREKGKEKEKSNGREEDSDKERLKDKEREREKKKERKRERERERAREKKREKERERARADERDKEKEKEDRKRKRGKLASWSEDEEEPGIIKTQRWFQQWRQWRHSNICEICYWFEIWSVRKFRRQFQQICA
eukprot:TRINITY_DN3674_c0_g1_i1.p1 TRINITY_DN3674_c0_g1~~TRINITY_DN3674_c0_g1_i1.p1  ORF type:complete len:463 (-),score=72.53 TRINITY_DN3674_c0_g1_i1:428-1816(-)